MKPLSKMFSMNSSRETQVMWLQAQVESAENLLSAQNDLVRRQKNTIEAQNEHIDALRLQVEVLRNVVKSLGGDVGDLS